MEKQQRKSKTERKWKAKDEEVMFLFKILFVVFNIGKTLVGCLASKLATYLADIMKRVRVRVNISEKIWDQC